MKTISKTTIGLKTMSKRMKFIFVTAASLAILPINAVATACHPSRCVFAQRPQFGLIRWKAVATFKASCYRISP